MKVAVLTVPYITSQQHIDWALEAFESFKSSHEIVHIGIINKLADPYKDLLSIYDYYEENGENCLSSAWNKGIRKAIEMGCAFILIPNLDVVLASNCIDNMVEVGMHLHGSNCILWTATILPNKEETSADWKMSKDYISAPDFSCFMLSASSMSRLAAKDPDPNWAGRFCELYKPAYFEDNDLHRRINLAGFEARAYLCAKFFHYASGTIKADTEIRESNHKTFSECARTYAHRWGGGVGQETLTIPNP